VVVVVVVVVVDEARTQVRPRGMCHPLVRRAPWERLGWRVIFAGHVLEWGVADGMASMGGDGRCNRGDASCSDD
jgi:hypothetical protein